MTQELIERLRIFGDDPALRPGVILSKTLLQAANALERLTAERDALKEGLDLSPTPLQLECERLRLELGANARLFLDDIARIERDRDSLIADQKIQLGRGAEDSAKAIKELK